MYIMNIKNMYDQGIALFSSTDIICPYIVTSITTRKKQSLDSLVLSLLISSPFTNYQLQSGTTGIQPGQNQRHLLLAMDKN